MKYLTTLFLLFFSLSLFSQSIRTNYKGEIIHPTGYLISNFYDAPSVNSGSYLETVLTITAKEVCICNQIMCFCNDIIPAMTESEMVGNYIQYSFKDNNYEFLAVFSIVEKRYVSLTYITHRGDTMNFTFKEN